MNIDLTAERYIINRYVSMPKLFDSLGIDYRIDGNFMCPFHYNEKTPAAHLYSDANGYRLWCFSEGRMYGAWDTYKAYLPKINTRKLASMIYEKMSESDKKRLENEIGNDIELEVLPYKDSLIKFKQRKICTTELLQDIASSYV